LLNKKRKKNMSLDITNSAVSEENLDQLQSQLIDALAFKEELVSANPKTLLSQVFTKQAGVVDIEVDDLQVLPDFNVRLKDAEYHTHIRSLADSMKANGYYKDKPLAAIGVMSGKKSVIYITDGHCRYAALQIAIAEGAPIKMVPVSIKDKSTTMEDLTVALVRSNEGRKLRPLELAIACKRMIKFGRNEKEIGEAFGLTAFYVTNLLTLAGAPSAIRDMIESGVVPAQVAMDAIRKHGGDAVEVLTTAATKAKDMGASKVTKASIEGRSLPKKIVASVVTSVDSFASSLSKDARVRLTTLSEASAEELVGQKIEVDAASLLALLSAQAEMDASRVKQAEKVRIKEEAAKQTSLDMADGQGQGSEK
jgi:ParB family transcriptional regulator, chromosome partitioning protein